MFKQRGARKIGEAVHCRISRQLRDDVRSGDTIDADDLCSAPDAGGTAARHKQPLPEYAHLYRQMGGGALAIRLELGRGFGFRVIAPDLRYQQGDFPVYRCLGFAPPLGRLPTFAECRVARRRTFGRSAWPAVKRSEEED